MPGSNTYKVYYLPTNDFTERPVPVGQVSAVSFSNITYTITLPTSLTLNKEGCSSVQTATISQVTPTNGSVNIGNGVLDSQYGLYLRDQSDNSIQFPANGSTSQTFVVCSYTNTSLGSLTVPVTVVGDANVQYALSSSNITVTVSQPLSPTPPIIQPSS